jgi:serine protease
MNAMQDKFGVVFVAAAGNTADEVATWPQLAAANVNGMLVVGATAEDGTRSSFSCFGDLVNAWAPGKALPKPPGGFDFDEAKGTSFGKYRCTSHVLPGY